MNGPSWNAHTAGDPREDERPGALAGLTDAWDAEAARQGERVEVWASSVTTGPVAVVPGAPSVAWLLGETIAKSLSTIGTGVYRAQASHGPETAYFLDGRRLPPAEADTYAREEARRGRL